MYVGLSCILLTLTYIIDPFHLDSVRMTWSRDLYQRFLATEVDHMQDHIAVILIDDNSLELLNDKQQGSRNQLTDVVKGLECAHPLAVFFDVYFTQPPTEPKFLAKIRESQKLLTDFSQSGGPNKNSQYRSSFETIAGAVNDTLNFLDDQPGKFLEAVYSLHDNKKLRICNATSSNNLVRHSPWEVPITFGFRESGDNNNSETNNILYQSGFLFSISSIMEEGSTENFGLYPWGNHIYPPNELTTSAERSPAFGVMIKLCQLSDAETSKLVGNTGNIARAPGDPSSREFYDLRWLSDYCGKSPWNRTATSGFPLGLRWTGVTPSDETMRSREGINGDNADCLTEEKTKYINLFQRALFALNISGLGSGKTFLHCKPFFTVSYFDLMASSAEDQAKLYDQLQGRIIFVGYDTSLSTDFTRSPIHDRLPGVFQHATATYDLLQFGLDYPRVPNDLTRIVYIVPVLCLLNTLRIVASIRRRHAAVIRFVFSRLRSAGACICGKLRRTGSGLYSIRERRGAVKLRARIIRIVCLVSVFRVPYLIWAFVVLGVVASLFHYYLDWDWPTVISAVLVKGFATAVSPEALRWLDRAFGAIDRAAAIGAVRGE